MRSYLSFRRHLRMGQCVGQRAKADVHDADLIARQVMHEGTTLRVWSPLIAAEQRFWQLLRWLQVNAAVQGRRSVLWEPISLRLRQRGQSSTAAFAALARKLARLCFALLRKGTAVNPDSHPGTGQVT